MTSGASVQSLWRHPIKAHGRETVGSVVVEAGRTMPWDRVWAVAHQKSDADGTSWSPCRNFTRGANIPALMAIEAKLDEAGRRVTLTHPELGSLAFCPDDEAQAFLDWIAPLHEDSPFKPARIVTAGQQGMTDSAFPSLTICNLASHRAVEEAAGRPLSIHRWRGNIWVGGLAPWEEFEMIGREIRIGEAILAVRERTGRCKATHADPETGARDIDMLGLLQGFGHTDFSVQAEVTRGGRITAGDTVRLT
ncbi:molybdenum cofactor biosysynthesis protein [Roseivivax halodurans JCM 10272]|uniref:Molybdenum cofactor biosysynthesis protein n=1 Tax=Roseivivax halodurans JCM 10272 TaxID=1449350 RepID=X7EGB3_9RHOB|nr:MOSC N-terminal beta barrel domain-containing protein [Roseivivax halodurans]ETX14947.1 molybdenum cofactor biosysynthesis protein [Roseivivax halodurans JCM 10272]